MGNHAPMLDGFRRISIRRPQFPLILEWIDREFQVIWKNLDATKDANIICLMKDGPEDDEPQDEDEERE